MKRLFDIVVSAFLLVVLSPLLVVLALASWASTGRPFFLQERPGLGGRPFRMVKFCTMNSACGSDGAPLDDGERITRLGAFMRRFSLDELPELWNVLVGQMSLVGPRPLLMEYLDLYTAEQARRHEVRPGITGWAQVSGRNRLAWPERFAADVWYVDHHTMALDVRILWMTIAPVLTGHGVTEPGHASMSKFTGSEQDAGPSAATQKEPTE